MNLYIDTKKERDQRRLSLLAISMEDEAGKAVYDTVRLALDAIEKSVYRDAATLPDPELRFRLGQVNALRGVLEMPKAAIDYIEKAIGNG